MIINSKENSHVKLIKSLGKKKYRSQHGLYITEGTRAVREALNYPDQVENIYVSKTYSLGNKDFIKGYNVIIIEDYIFKDLSNTITSQGIMATVKYKIKTLEDLEKGFYILSDGIQDPGNLGGIIRSIDAFAFDGLIVGPGTVDPFNGKVVRSTMGSIHRVDIFQYEKLGQLKNCQMKIYTSDLNKNSTKLFDADLSKPMIIIIGNEGNGISKEAREIFQESIYIPMEGDTESLNANVSASLIMYETMRQKWK